MASNRAKVASPKNLKLVKSKTIKRRTIPFFLLRNNFEIPNSVDAAIDMTWWDHVTSRIVSIQCVCRMCKDAVSLSHFRYFNLAPSTPSESRPSFNPQPPETAWQHWLDIASNTIWHSTLWQIFHVTSPYMNKTTLKEAAFQATIDNCQRQVTPWLIAHI